MQCAGVSAGWFSGPSVTVSAPERPATACISGLMLADEESAYGCVVAGVCTSACTRQRRGMLKQGVSWRQDDAHRDILAPLW